MIKHQLLLLLLMLCISISLKAQKSTKYPGWEVSVVTKANTAIDSEFMNEDEKEVILLSNLARVDGPFFTETFLKQYLILKDKKSNKYIRSLYKDLQKVKDLPMLLPEKELYDVARDHATKSGVKGYEGHKGFKNRYTPVMENFMEVGENIYYGEYTPVEIVLQLLIDEGIEDLGHRHNLLNPRFNSLGVSIKPHKEYKYNCVMSFGLLPRSYEDYIQ
ncbi:MAG TPA: CAP domain-containing protein [Bacteroides sp.]|nr:CAP domain-containing protein [Bacteroides sp.]